jgi:hypothetical protein
MFCATRITLQTSVSLRSLRKKCYGGGMGRRANDLEFAINLSRSLLKGKKAVKNEAERRRMFDRFCILSGLYTDRAIQMLLLKDGQRGQIISTPIPPDPEKQSSKLDDQAQKMLRQLQNGGGDGNNASGTTD